MTDLVQYLAKVSRVDVTFSKTGIWVRDDDYFDMEICVDNVDAAVEIMQAKVDLLIGSIDQEEYEATWK